MSAELRLEDLARRGAALIIVDLQNEFCKPDGFYGKRGQQLHEIDDVIANVKRLREAAAGLGVPSVFTTISYDPRLPRLENRHKILAQRIPSGERLVPGEWGAAIVDELKPSPDDFVIDKPDFSAFYQTSLESLLRRLGVEVVVLTGVLSNACLLHTAFDAFVRDLDVVVVSDTIASWDHSLTNSALEVLGAVVGQVVDTDTLLER